MDCPVIRVAFTYFPNGPTGVRLIMAVDFVRRRLSKMTRISNACWKLLIWKDVRGQDLIEYALMAGFVAVAAGAVVPGVTSSISTIFSQVTSVLTTAASQS